MQASKRLCQVVKSDLTHQPYVVCAFLSSQAQRPEYCATFNRLRRHQRAPRVTRVFSIVFAFLHLAVFITGLVRLKSIIYTPHEAVLTPNSGHSLNHHGGRVISETVFFSCRAKASTCSSCLADNFIFRHWLRSIFPSVVVCDWTVRFA